MRGNPDWDTTALKRVDGQHPRIHAQEGRQGGADGAIDRGQDGKTRTVTVTGVNAQGQKIKPLPRTGISPPGGVTAHARVFLGPVASEGKRPLGPIS